MPLKLAPPSVDVRGALVEGGCWLAGPHCWWKPGAPALGAWLTALAGDKARSAIAQWGSAVVSRGAVSRRLA
ncbi:MAG TPA: hypothetical protein P5114_10735, partial [Hyphomicrobiaceae bacterium]|nr:hypothetical protein [Hyphomicrobiaceae bacterium]